MEGEYYKTKESVDEYIKLAEGFNGADLIKTLKKVLSPNSTVLEIGSGPGSDWKILNESYNVLGSDNSTEFLNHLIAENPNGEFLELDAKTLRTDKKFDGIYSNKVMHHLRNNELAESIKRQHDILNPKGIICHSFWKGEGSEVFKGLFVNYHTKANLKKFYEDSFEILSLEDYQEFDEGDSLLLIAKKK
ncbi:class I SAM-dependent methyltransferase [Flavivirga spongiicola]|uniref:Class I SAM-dependent methyltransferase n=1 Tax=Flavivirga spongiicola TaxID=421621 RepID=A0ABU7XSW3_9FLAO|nr:class I SAM-dependent methyltransferase [Flavivirga sp. MEBiC05379]MDO5978538.1 class I SAM-dependent methyltransferase [Flavivirga sp. MEBiC05379]